MLIRLLSRALVPIALGATLLAQAPPTHAESTVFTPARRGLPVPSLEIPHVSVTSPRSVGIHPAPTLLPVDRIACTSCAPAPALEANWGDGVSMSSDYMLIKGQNFTDGDSIEVDVLGDFSHLFLYSTTVTSSGGVFELMPGFEVDIDTGALQCSSPVTVAATDLTALHASGQPQAPVQTTPTGCTF